MAVAKRCLNAKGPGVMGQSSTMLETLVSVRFASTGIVPFHSVRLAYVPVAENTGALRFSLCSSSYAFQYTYHDAYSSVLSRASETEIMSLVALAWSRVCPDCGTYNHDYISRKYNAWTALPITITISAIAMYAVTALPPSHRTGEPNTQPHVW